MAAAVMQAPWGDRREDLSSVTARLSKLLNAVGTIEPSWEPWLSSWRSRRVERPFEVSLPDIVAAGVNRRDSDNQPIRHLGFSGRLASWGALRNLDVLFGCGGYDLGTLSNRLVVREITQIPESALGGPARARAVLEAVVNAMRPDYATFTSRDALVGADTRPGLPRPGWLMYISDAVFDAPSQPLERNATDTGSIFVAPTPWTSDQLAGRGAAGDFAAALRRRSTA